MFNYIKSLFKRKPIDLGYYAVIYDWTDINGEVVEEYYERFMDPQEAAKIFRSAFPEGSTKTTQPFNARLVKVLGPIDNYHEGEQSHA